MPHAAMSPNNVAVVTGGASGIGLAAAMRFARLGMKVCIADLTGNRLAEAEAKLLSAAAGGAANVMVLAADVSRIEDVSVLEAAVRERFGGADILMNNAGIQPGSQIFGPLENWRRILGVNLWGVIHGSQVFAPRMIARTAGPHHQHRLEAGHHHPARRSRLQRLQGRRESLHRGAAARIAQRGGQPDQRASVDPRLCVHRTYRPRPQRKTGRGLDAGADRRLHDRTHRRRRFLHPVPGQ